MKYTPLQKLASWLLVLCVLSGVMPTGLIRGAAAQIMAQNKAVYGESMDWVLDCRGETLTAGQWEYMVVQPWQYAVITGHTDASAVQLEVPAVLGGADVVALASGALEDHHALETLRLPGNVNAIAADAIPQGVTLQGYHANYAHRFAVSAGYPFQNLSEFDFLAGVIDYADVSTDAFRRVSANEVHMRRLEASRLAVGSRFFLVDPANPYQISYYRVTAISESETEGFVRLDCETPVLDELMASYSGQNETMVLDMSTLQLEEGVTLDNTLHARASDAKKTPRLSAGFTMPLGKGGPELDVSFYVQSSFTTDYSGSVFTKKSMTVTENRKTGVTIAFSADKDMLDPEDEEEQEDPNEFSVEKAIRKAKEKKETHQGKFSTVNHEERVGTGMFFSYAGVVSLDVAFVVKISVAGEIELSYKEESEIKYYGDSDGNVHQTTRNISKDCDVQGAVKLKVGGAVELNGYLLMACIVQVYGFAGLKAEVSFTWHLGEESDHGTYISPNMADCVMLEAKIVFEIGIKAGLLKVFDFNTEELGMNVGASKSFDVPIFEKHFHLLPHCFVPGSTPDTCIYDKTREKEQFHDPKDCPYQGAKIVFRLPALREKDQLYFESSTMELGFAIYQPADPYKDDDRFRFNGWYATEALQPGTEISWPYTLTEKETTFYGDVDISCLLRITDQGGTEIVPAAYVFPDSVFTLPENVYSTTYWYVSVKSGLGDNVTLVPVEEYLEADGSGGFIMPEEDVHIIASPTAALQVDFAEKIDDNAPQTIGSINTLPGMALSALPASIEGLLDLGWIDSGNTAITFPYTVPGGTAALTLIHRLSSDMDYDFADNGYGIQTGEEAFTYTKYATYVQITGYNKNRTRTDETGATVSYTQNAYNLKIPSTIEDLPVTSIASAAFDNIDTLITVFFPSSVTSIGARALEGCDNLLYIDMSAVSADGVPDSFAKNCPRLADVDLPARAGFSVGSYAFYNTNLVKVTVRGDVGSYAFAACKSLYKAEVGSGAAQVGEYAFSSCKNLRKITFADSVSVYGGNMLKDCLALEELTVGGGYKETSSLPFLIGEGAALRKVTVREGVTVLPAYAFANYNSARSTCYAFTGLEELSLPASLQSIGDRAFYLSGLESLEIAGSIASIGQFAFGGNARLTDVAISGDACELGRCAFQGCQALETVTLEGVETIGDEVFWNTGLQSISMGEGLKTVGFRAFAESSDLTSIEFPTTVTSLGDYALADCANLVYIDIGAVEAAGVPAYFAYNCQKLAEVMLPERTGFSVGDYSFSSTALTSITLSGDVGIEAFGYCSALAHVEMLEGGTRIGAHAFRNCTALKSIAFPDSVTEYGGGILLGCTALEELTVGGGYQSTSSYTFYIGENAVLRKVLVREGVKALPAKAFANYSSSYVGFPVLMEVYLPASLESIGAYAFYKSGLMSLRVSGRLSSIGKEAFRDIDSLTSVEISGTACTIGNMAFEDCDGLQSVSLSGVQVIDSYAFYRSGVQRMELGGGLTTVGEYAFADCTNLGAIAFPDSVTSYGAKSLKGCLALEELTVGGGYQETASTPFYIGEGAVLRKVTIREGVTAIPDYAFANYDADSKKYYAFPYMTTLALPGTLESIGAYAFYQSGLTGLSVSGRVTSIGKFAFYMNTSLRSVFIAGKDCTIGSRAFYKCTSPYAAVLRGVKTIEEDAFWHSGLQSISMAEGLTTVGSQAFAYCTRLKAVAFPDSVTSYGSYLLYGSLALEELTVGGGYQEKYKASGTFYIGQGAALRKLVIREGVTFIPQAEFGNYWANSEKYYGFPNLTTVALPDSLQMIGKQNLNNWPAVKTLRLGPNITSIDCVSGLLTNKWMTIVTDEYHEYAARYASLSCAKYQAMDPASYPYHTVRFVSALAGVHTGETALEDGTVLVDSRQVRFLGTYTPPELTTPGGYTFTGWYRDSACTHAWLAGDPMGTEDITLYAGFAPKSRAVFAVRAPEGYTLDAAPAGGTELPEGFVLYARTQQDAGKAIVLPAEPVFSGFLFTGWHYDAALTRPFISDAATAEGITLYGGFVPASTGSVWQQEGSGLTITAYHMQPDDGAKLVLPGAMNGVPVRAVADHAFAGCGITSITLPATLEQVSSHAFAGCSALADIHVAAENEHFTSYQGVLYNKDMTILYRYPEGKAALSFTVPSSVLAIAPYAFENCRSLKAISMPEGVATIHEGAFSGCSGLRHVTLPDTLVNLGSRAFALCSGMRSFTAQALGSIGADALPANAYLAVYGPQGDNPLRAYCKASAQLRNNYNAYYLEILLDGKPVALTLCEAGQPIPAGYTYGELDNGLYVTALYKDAALTQPWVDTDLMPAADLTLYTTGVPLFVSEKITITTADGTVEGVILTAYNGCGGDVVLPRMVGTLPVIALGEAFLSTTRGNVNSVDIGSGVIQIADTALDAGSTYTFEGDVLADAGSYAAQWAARMGYSCANSLYTLSFNVMGGAEVTSRQAAAGTAIRLPEPVKTGAAFLGWYMDEALTTPAALDSNGLFAMPARSLTLYAGWKVTEAVYCPYEYTEVNGCVTITAYTGSALSETLPAEINGLPVTTIAPGAFAGAALESVTLPESIASIGEGAFAGSSLKSIAMPGVISIGDEAFSGCAALESAALPEGLESIGRYAFMGCSALTSVTLPDSLTSLGEATFMNCTALAQAHISSGLETMGSRAFSGCSALSAFTATEGGSCTVKDGVLYSGGGLTLLCCPAGYSGECIIAEGTMFIAPYAFEQCSGLTGVVLADTVTSIGEGAFARCTQLEEIRLGAQVETINAAAFDGTQVTLVVEYGSPAHAYARTNNKPFRFTEEAEVASITLPESITISLGGQLLPEVTILPEAAAATAVLTWHTADSSICAYASGALHALKRGTTTVTVTAQNGVSATATLTVQGPPAESVVLPAIEQEMARGSVFTLAAELLPAWAEISSLAWSSSDENVAAVDANGVVTCTGAGEVTIRATAANGRQGETTFTVFNPVEVLECAEESITLSILDTTTHQLDIAVLPADHTYGAISYASSDMDVITVDASGLITAVGLGEAYVSVTSIHTGGEPITLDVPVTVQPCSLAGLTLPDIEPMTYNGEEQLPEITIMYMGRLLQPGEDYILTMEAPAIHAGTHTYTIEGINQYAGTAVGTFEILPAMPALSYCGHSVRELHSFVPDYVVDLPVEVTASYIAQDGSLLTETPTEPGEYILQLRTDASNDWVSVTLQISITLVESYVTHLQLSCDALTLEVGQTVNVVPTIGLVENAPDDIFFSWDGDSAVVSLADGLLTALTPGETTISLLRDDRPEEAATIRVTVVEAGSLQAFRLASALAVIEEEAFAGVPGVQKVILPDAVTSLGARVFADMPALCQLYLPDSLQSFAADLIDGTDAVVFCKPDTPAAERIRQLGLPYVLLR